jgi:pimeloyl-ACP methyl ester carboxylesterase
MGSSTHWQKNIDALARDFRVHAIDLPGFGEAPDVPKDISADDYLKLARHGIAMLFELEGTAALVGFSFGGAVAADLARHFGARTRCLALIGPGGFGNFTQHQFGLRRAPLNGAVDTYYRAVIRHNLLAMMLREPATVDDATIDLQCANIARTRFVSLKVGRRKNLVADLAATSCPLLLIWGEHDALALPSIATRIAQCRSVRPDLDAKIVPGGGHWIQYERPKIVNSLLTKFIADRFMI